MLNFTELNVLSVVRQRRHSTVTSVFCIRVDTSMLSVQVKYCLA